MPDTTPASAGTESPEDPTAAEVDKSNPFWRHMLNAKRPMSPEAQDDWDRFASEGTPG